MHAWLKRAVAGLLSAGTLMGGGLLMAGTANADEIRMPDIGKTITSTARTIAGKSGSLPTELVNGSFSYKGRQCLDTARKAAGNDYQSDWNFANIDYVKGDAGAARKWAHIDGFQATGFGWKSNQTDTAVDGRAPIAEIQQSRDGSNYYGEITASQANTYLYQDIGTQHSSGTVYTVKLKHASRTLAMGTDSLQVLVGTPGHERPVELTRIASDGKDQVGEKSNVVASAVSGWNGKWDTYTGSVIIPANQPVTRFTFKSITGIDNVAGNLIDDVQFAYAYPLSYDANGGTKKQASRISSKTFGKASETDGKAKTMQDASGLPANAVPAADAGQEKLTNGDFEYPGARSLHMGHSINWSAVERKSGERFEPSFDPNACKWVKLDGFDANRFGWDSSETDGPSVGAPNQRRANEVELQLDRNDNIYAELVANQAGTSIKQTIRTVKDVAYTVSLKHASLTDEYVDRMRVVMIAADGTRTVVPMTRTVSNGHGDKVGEKSEVIATKVTNTDTSDHAKQWETYTGTYIATGGSTTFTFESVDSRQANLGNLLDDVSFKTAYKLDYDGNNGKGRVPSSSKADSTQPAAFKAPAAKAEAIASRAAGDEMAVNGGFDTPKWTIAKEGQGLPWVYVKPNKGTIRSYAQAMAGQTGVKAGGLTAATFAWQDLDAIGSNQNFELHREKDGNTAADVHAGRTVAQTVNTTPGASYTFSIRHSGRSKGNAGGVTLLTGPDKDHLTPVKLTRTTVSKTGQKYGDKTGDVGTVAYTHSDSMDATEGSHEPWDHSDDWESYEGTVIIPAGQSRTMIAYRGVAKDGTLTASANDSIIDDLSFRLAYKLSYDANGGAKKSTSQIKASTDGKVKTIAGKTDSLPTELVNGSFDYPAGLIAGVSTKYPWDDWTVVDPINGRYARHIGIDKDPWAPIPGWDASKFAWKSTQTKGTDWQQIAQGIELQKDSKTGNQYAELVAGQAGTAIYQDIATIPGVSYRWELKHASLDRTHLDGMSVMIGEPGKESAQDATRTTVNGNGDQPGDVGKVISTKVRNKAELGGSSNHSSRNHDGQWETYTGTYIATGTVTRFTFKSVSSSNNVNGNILDDLSFTKAYRLGYDGNGGTGQVPSRTETGRTETAASGTDGTVRLAADKSAEPESGTIADDRRMPTDTIARQDDGTRQRTITRSDGSVRVETIATTGAVSGCQVYYPAGTRITLATAKADSDCWDSSQIGKTNRTFYGWSANTDANDRDVPVGDTMDRNTLNANARTEIVMPARAKTVYALWAINPTLSYNVNTPAGSNAPGTPASRTVPYNTAASDTSGWTTGDTGKIPGYRFDGWYTAPNGGNKYDFNTPLTNNVTVYAHWIGNGYTVRFTGNGATGGNTPDQAFQYNIGQNLRRNGFTRDGYTFTGWKRADNQQAYGDGQWVNNLTTQPDGIVTMVAQWSANEAHIRYNPNPPAGKTAGGNGTPNWDGHTGDTPAIGGNGWTIDGYTFAGWTTSPDGGGTKYAPGASWTANGTLTLYAQWTPGEAGLTYDGNGATGGKTDPQNGVTDQKVNVRQNGFTRDGYTFVRWDTQADCRGKAVNLGDKWTLQGSSTLYACWAGNVQTLTYHGNGATDGNTAAQSGKTGDELTTNANGFTRDGYTFVEWNTKADGTGGHYGKGTNGVAKWTMLPAGNDLYAIWQANPANIRYRDDWGATGSTPDTTGVTGQNVTIAQNGFTRPGYTFTGWARDRRTDPSLQPGGRYTLTPGTTTLWAQWKADPAHLIYNSNSGSTSQTRRTDGVVDQTLTVIANPFTRSGYTFTGWNTQADGRGKAYAAGNGFRLVADAKSNPVNTTVLYAQWRINRVALKFDPNGGTGGYPDITADAFTTVTIPADAKEPKVQRPGFRFTGWAMKPTPGNGDTILGPGKGTVAMPDQGSITVYAQWAPAMTTLPFTGGHAQVPTIGLYAGLAFMILAMGALMPVIRLRMGAGSKGRHAGTPTIGRHSR